MVPQTKQKIIKYLQEHHRASAPELSEALSMTRANIRYHLEQLIEEMVIEEDRTIPVQAGRGRPIKRYSLSTSSRPNNFPELTGALLKMLLRDETEDRQLQVLRQLANSMAGNQSVAKNLTQRIIKAVQGLNNKNYQAKWEARPQGPQIIFRNCPYAAVLPGHPELCQIDIFLLERMLAQPVNQIAQIGNRSAACLFILGKQNL